MRPGAVRSLLAACLLAVLALGVGAAFAASTASAQTTATAPVRHVVVVGISGLRWSDVSPSVTPTLWRLVGQGSVGSLVDYAVLPLTCPADAWLTLNAGDRAQSDHTNAACGAFPAVTPAGAGALVPAMGSLEAYNNQFHNSPDWGLLAKGVPGCATAVGPGAALALADSTGHVASYLPSAADLTAGVLARCPLTVVDLGNIGSAERSSALASVDAQLARIAADVPAGSTLLVTAPGATTKPPHLQLALVDGPGYQAGLLTAASTRQPGLVVLTDLTPTMLGWLGGPASANTAPANTAPANTAPANTAPANTAPANTAPANTAPANTAPANTAPANTAPANTVPADAVGAQITRGDRGSLTSTVQSLAGRDTAEQVWTSTHDEFFWAYALADAVVLAGIGLAFWPGMSPGITGMRPGITGMSPGIISSAAEDKRRRRARWWRVAGVFAAAVPVATFLANLVPWSLSAHPAAWLYTTSVALAAVIALAALLGPWRRDPLAPFGVVCLFTLVVLGIDVMTGSRLQLETPFGLSVLEAGRFYGIGNEALGIYGISGLLGAAWLGLVALRRSTPSRRPAVLAVAVVATFAVFASGWPGFGGKVGGTIAMVPCFVLLAMAVAGIRLNWRLVLLVAVSGLALFAVFALVNYFVPITGKSDISSFAGNSLHGHSGNLLLRKINSNIGSLSVNAFSPLIPIVVVWTGLMLWRPAWFALKTERRAYAAEPLMRPILGVLWLLPVLGWFADDSGVIVPAAALPFALPLGIGILAAAAYQDRQARYRETIVPIAGSSPVSRK